jgi:hypothetical protein
MLARYHTLAKHGHMSWIWKLMELPCLFKSRVFTTQSWVYKAPRYWGVEPFIMLPLAWLQLSSFLVMLVRGTKDVILCVITDLSKNGGCFDWSSGIKLLERKSQYAVAQMGYSF